MNPTPESPLAKLMTSLPQAGHAQWIGLRPAQRQAMAEIESGEAASGGGLHGGRIRLGDAVVVL